MSISFTYVNYTTMPICRGFLSIGCAGRILVYKSESEFVCSWGSIRHTIWRSIMMQSSHNSYWNVTFNTTGFLFLLKKKKKQPCKPHASNQDNIPIGVQRLAGDKTYELEKHYIQNVCAI